MKGLLVWPDGRAQATSLTGGRSVIRIEATRTGYLKHEFTLEGVQDEGLGPVWIYRWSRSQDHTEAMRRADEANHEATNRVIRAGLCAIERGEG